MEKTGTASLPLHGGRAPRWLFSRMKKLAGSISEVIIEEYSREELLRKLSDPYWFQSFACVLGYDWHSSGTTTVTCGALKEALDEEEHGIRVVGGKGATSRKAPEEILSSSLCSSNRLEQIERSSRMSAKVDSNCLQDTYSLYHHVLIFTEKGDWAVIQQGMNPSSRYARRYHWLSEKVRSFVNEPHQGISAQHVEDRALNLTSRISDGTRKVSVDLIKDGPQHLERFLKPKGQSSIFSYTGIERSRDLEMPTYHHVSVSELTKNTLKNMEEAYERQPEDYEELVSLKGVGMKTLRALALISELVYGTENDWKDPAKFSYSLGGKDGTPYPVNMDRYDKVIEELKIALNQAKVGKNEKLKAIKRLNKFKEID